MKNIHIPEIQEILKKNHMNLIAAILFLMVACGFFVWEYFEVSQKDIEPIFLHELIADGSKKEKLPVKVDIIGEPYAFAEASSEYHSDRYYFLRDNQYLYVGYLDYSTYLRLQSTSFGDGSVILKGVSKKIPEDIIDFAIQVYNQEKGEEFLTRSNYKLYIGEICIDTTRHNVSISFPLLFALISLIISAGIGIIYDKQNRQIKKMIASYTNQEWIEIEHQLREKRILSNSKMHVYFTEDYVIDMSHGLYIFRYCDIVWVYPYQLKQYGIVVSQSLVIFDKDRKKSMIAVSNRTSQKNLKLIDDFIMILIQKNPSILVGYTEKNRKKARDLYQIK